MPEQEITTKEPTRRTWRYIVAGEIVATVEESTEALTEYLKKRAERRAAEEAPPCPCARCLSTGTLYDPPADHMQAPGPENYPECPACAGVGEVRPRILYGRWVEVPAGPRRLM